MRSRWPRDAASPVAPRSDEADTAADDDKSDQSPDKGADKDKGAKGSPAPDKAGAITPIRVDLDGMMARAVALPIDAANLAQTDVRDHRVFYLTQPIGLIGGRSRARSRRCISTT